MFKSQNNPGYVDYVAFFDEMESVFTVKGLEKQPTRVPEEFTNYVYESGSTPYKPLDTAQENPILQRVLSRLAEMIRERRIDMVYSRKNLRYRSKAIWPTLIS